MATTSPTRRQLYYGERNAFDGIAPSTSTVSSLPLKQLPFDVFINHCGIDSKYTLASSIYHSLSSSGLRIFLDVEELHLGDYLPTTIEAAMRSASLHIAIFSKNYAQSPWCLAELAYLLETDTIIIPIFYHVEPYDLRWVVQGKGLYANAFSQHENKSRYTSDQLQRWKRALHNASFYSGEIINNHDDEQRVLKNVVNRVMKAIKTVPLEVAKHPVGLKKSVKEFEMTALQSADSTQENGQIVGIWGMGGSGKTTLAKELYNKNCLRMERTSILFDIRDAARKGLLNEKQKKLLEDLGVNHASFDNVEQGKGILASRLRYVSVLIIFDDVDHMDHLDALLPATNKLGRGSLIIVTTRQLEVLRSWGISTVYKIRALDPYHAKQLFCWHSFLQPSPPCEFEDLVERFLASCNGLPLSLKVLGGQLYGNSCKNYWESHLQKMSKILPNDIRQRLKLSYDALDEEEKEMFLDTACFFIGEKINLAIEVWDGSRWSGLHSWERLVSKCFVEIDDYNRIRMHDHLRDLGKEIANRQSPYRLWFSGQIIHIQRENANRQSPYYLWFPQLITHIHPQQQTLRIRGIKEARSDYWSQGKIIVNTSEGFLSLKHRGLGLKILLGSGHFHQDFVKLSSELVWLKWSGFEHRKIPSWLSLKKLRVLELYRASSLQELWDGEADVPLQLRDLAISCTEKFKGFPRSIERLKHLKKLKVDTAFGEWLGMTSLREEFCFLQSLEHLELRHCQKLSSLPGRFGDLTNLRHLALDSCWVLRMLPLSFKPLTLLEYLDLSRCRQLTITSDNLDILENMTKLHYLSLSLCEQLEELPRHMANLASLRELYLDGTQLREMPTNIGRLSKLRVPRIGSDLLTCLPSSLRNLSSLSKLEIRYCGELECLPESLGRLNLLEDLSIFRTGVKSLPKSFTKLINLQTVMISNSPISEVSFGPRCKLRRIDITNTKISKVSISEDCCPCLRTFYLWENRLLTDVEMLPTTVETIILFYCRVLKCIRGIGGLVSFQTLKIGHCSELDALPCFAELTSLKEFQLQGYHKVEKIEGFENLRSLEILQAYAFWKVPGIHSLEHMERLRRLELVANERSAIEHSIRTIQKWPCEVIICTRAVGNVGQPVNAFSFPNLCVVDVRNSILIRDNFSHLSPHACNCKQAVSKLTVSEAVKVSENQADRWQI